MSEIERYTALKRAVIILSIIVVLLLAMLVGFFWSLYTGHTAQFGPDKGVWYCSELSLQVSYNYGAEAHLFVDGKNVLCTIVAHPQSQFLRVFEVKDTLETSEGPAYVSGALLFDFRYLSFESEQFTVSDGMGNEYIFVRVE